MQYILAEYLFWVRNECRHWEQNIKKADTDSLSWSKYSNGERNNENIRKQQLLWENKRVVWGKIVRLRCAGQERSLWKKKVIFKLIKESAYRGQRNSIPGGGQVGLTSFGTNQLGMLAVSLAIISSRAYYQTHTTHTAGGSGECSPFPKHPVFLHCSTILLLKTPTNLPATVSKLIL